mmetsp:Transcript_19420/g.27676  ORF Transcript_19420/g.27676 Transcript_19420/m.27676 type:complete len:83 (+) Transcript_19420:564-812(+)
MTPVNPLETNTPISSVQLYVTSSLKSSTSVSITASQGITATTKQQQPLAQELAKNDTEIVAAKDVLIYHAPVWPAIESNEYL